ncbi:MAG: hypothetical protein AAGK71_09205 [Pseudomonadota bacterium]
MMHKTRVVMVAGLAVILTTGAALAVTPAERLDRIEDRIDARESRIDQRVDLGPRDVIEDRIDRRESIRDRRGFDGPSWIDRHERRSWRRVWGNQ